MINIKADKYAVTIQHNNKLVSFPTGSIIIRKSDEDQLDFISVINSDRFKVKMDEIHPRVSKNFKNGSPSEEDNKKGKEKDIWHDNKSGTYFIHDGNKFCPTSKKRIMEIYIHMLSSYINGAKNFK